jgi:hypothetical protein
MLEIVFNIFNTGILIFWMMLLFFPKQQITHKITNYPWVPLAVALGYVYFLLNAEGAMSGANSDVSKRLTRRSCSRMASLLSLRFLGRLLDA